MDRWCWYLILIPIAYLAGSVNFASVISYFKKKNIRNIGSGNPGTMNMLRSVGKFWGCLTFILDFFKGVALALVGMFVLKSHFDIYLLGLFTVIGHVFSCFLKFKGGKGVATSLGVFGVANPVAMLIAFLLLMVYLYFFKTGFIGSLLCISSLVITESIYHMVAPWECHDYRIIILVLVIECLVIFTHRGNIKRLIKGEENSLSLFKAEENKETGNIEIENNEQVSENNH